MSKEAVAEFFSKLPPSGGLTTGLGASEDLTASAAPMVASQPPVTRRRTSDTASAAAVPPAISPPPARKRVSETASAAPYPLRTRRLSDSSAAPPGHEVASQPPVKPSVPFVRPGKLDPINAIARGDFHHITPAVGGKGECEKVYLLKCSTDVYEVCFNSRDSALF